MARDKIVYYSPIAVLHGVTRVRFRAPPRIPRCCWLDAVPGVRPFVPFSQGPEMMPYWTYVKPNSCIISFSRLSAVFVSLFVRLFETFSRLASGFFPKRLKATRLDFCRRSCPLAPPHSSFLARLFCFPCMYGRCVCGASQVSSESTPCSSVCDPTHTRHARRCSSLSSLLQPPPPPSPPPLTLPTHHHHHLLPPLRPLLLPLTHAMLDADGCRTLAAAPPTLHDPPRCSFKMLLARAVTLVLLSRWTC